MAGRGARGKSKPTAKPRAAADEFPAARVVAPRRTIEPQQRRKGQIAISLGMMAVVTAIGVTVSLPDTSTISGMLFFCLYLIAGSGVIAISEGCARLDPRAELVVREDKRRWIYGGLSLVFGFVYTICMWKVIPNRLPSGMLHLASVPVFTVLMAAGTLFGKRKGWWLAVISGSVVLLSTILLIARILVSAAFLAGVYGAFGKAAATFALVAVALIVEVVALLPICQVKFLMSRHGRRAYGL
ncbi:MAG: hypothetical protein ABI867_44220 [Kofleriaceae bacterium]